MFPFKCTQIGKVYRLVLFPRFSILPRVFTTPPLDSLPLRFASPPGSCLCSLASPVPNVGKVGLSLAQRIRTFLSVAYPLIPHNTK